MVEAVIKRAFDLSKVIASLDEVKYKAFIKAVKALHAAFSVELDLEAARLSVTEVEQISNESVSDTLAHRANALLTHAVITYSRATHNKAISRYNVGVAGGYSSRLRQLHEQITELRDQCIAHFGSGDNWNDERVVQLVKHGCHGVTVVHRRTNYRTETIDALKELLAAGIPHVRELQRQRSDELLALLVAADDNLRTLIARHEFDVHGFLGASAIAMMKLWDEGAYSVSVKSE
jgi:hypothetical protein